jgi:hypothetical protein
MTLLDHFLNKHKNHVTAAKVIEKSRQYVSFANQTNDAKKRNELGFRWMLASEPEFDVTVLDDDGYLLTVKRVKNTL